MTYLPSVQQAALLASSSLRFGGTVILRQGTPSFYQPGNQHPYMRVEGDTLYLSESTHSPRTGIPGKEVEWYSVGNYVEKALGALGGITSDGDSLPGIGMGKVELQGYPVFTTHREQIHTLRDIGLSDRAIYQFISDPAAVKFLDDTYYTNINPLFRALIANDQGLGLFQGSLQTNADNVTSKFRAEGRYWEADKLTQLKELSIDQKKSIVQTLHRPETLNNLCDFLAGKLQAPEGQDLSTFIVTSPREDRD